MNKFDRLDLVVRLILIVLILISTIEYAASRAHPSLLDMGLLFFIGLFTGLIIDDYLPWTYLKNIGKNNDITAQDK